MGHPAPAVCHLPFVLSSQPNSAAGGSSCLGRRPSSVPRCRRYRPPSLVPARPSSACSNRPPPHGSSAYIAFETSVMGCGRALLPVTTMTFETQGFGQPVISTGGGPDVLEDPFAFGLSPLRRDHVPSIAFPSSSAGGTIFGCARETPF